MGDAWFDYFKDKSYEDKLIEFATTSERIQSLIYDLSRARQAGQDKESIDWYENEIQGQRKRQEWLFNELVRMYEEKGI